MGKQNSPLNKASQALRAKLRNKATDGLALDQWLALYLSPVSERVSDLHTRFVALAKDLSTLSTRVELLESQLREAVERTEQSFARAQERVLQVNHEVKELERRDSVRAHQAAVAEQRTASADAVKSLAFRTNVETVGEWLKVASHVEVFVTVLICTRHRPQLLDRAVQSVLRQTHPCFEIVIVDDGDDDHERVINHWADDRIRIHRASLRKGLAAARNFGLSKVKPGVVVYLDDDNTMGASWLAAVANAFAFAPQKNVLYGARILQPAPGAMLGLGNLEMSFEPYDRVRLIRHNYIDANTIAHRWSETFHPRFDEELVTCDDWEFFLRLTAAEEPLALPAVACVYTCDAPGRLSDDSRVAASVAAVHRKHPFFCVVFACSSFPIVSPSTRALAALLHKHGVLLAYAVSTPPDRFIGSSASVFSDLAQAVTSMRPDAIVVEDAQHRPPLDVTGDVPVAAVEGEQSVVGEGLSESFWAQVRLSETLNGDEFLRFTRPLYLYFLKQLRLIH